MARHLIDTAPVAGTCPRCRVAVLVATTSGLSVAVDPLPLTTTGELEAVCNAAHSYGLVDGVLVHRSVQHIHADRHRARPAVLATHHCDRPVPASHIDTGHAPKISSYLAEPAAADTEATAMALLTHELGAVPADEPPF